jgi:hypothetical protein
MSPQASVTTSNRESLQSEGKTTRAQPWKAHWPPAATTGVDKAYGFAKGEVVSIYGN